MLIGEEPIDKAAVDLWAQFYVQLDENVAWRLPLGQALRPIRRRADKNLLTVMPITRSFGPDNPYSHLLSKLKCRIFGPKFLEMGKN